MPFNPAGVVSSQPVTFEPLESRRVLAATYYVDPAGNDTNDGRSPQTPWQTIDRVNQKRFRPGDTLLFFGSQRYAVQGAPGANFVANGTFDTDLSGWDDTQGTDPANSTIITDPAFVHSGTGALKLANSAARTMDITSLVQANQTCEMTAWMKRTSPGAGDARVGVTFYAHGLKLGTFYRGSRDPNFTEYNWAFVPPIGFEQAVLWASKTSDASTLYVDDIDIHTIPNGIILDSNDSGTPDFPVTIGTYGKKPARLSAGNGIGISAVNASNINIVSLIVVGTWNAITGSGPSAGEGVDLVNTQPGDTKLQNVQVINVESKGFRWAGVQVEGVNGNSGFNNVRVTKCRVRWNGDVGVITKGFSEKSADGYAHTNVRIDKNRVTNNTGIPGKASTSGNGILVTDCDAAIVERNVVYQNGNLNNNPDAGPAGIWAFVANNVVIQKNESFQNATGSIKDGAGFDLDGGVTNSVIQYNYSHDNDGPGFILAQFSGYPPFGNNVVRYNISENDARRNNYGSITLTGGSGVKNVLVENNTVYVTPAASGTASAVRLKGTGSGVAVRNNIFVTTGGAPFIDADTGSSSAAFNGNDYYATGDFRIRWLGVNYYDLGSWQSVGPETSGGLPTGFTVNPQLTAPSTGGMLLSAYILETLSAYQIAATSPLIDQAIDLPAPWDGYTPAAFDFYANPVPRGAARDIGAAEIA